MCFFLPYIQTRLALVFILFKKTTKISKLT